VAGVRYTGAGQCLRAILYLSRIYLPTLKSR
jgi:hypothetical protein